MRVRYVVMYGNGLSQAFDDWVNAAATLAYLLTSGGYSEATIKTQVYGG